MIKTKRTLIFFATSLIVALCYLYFLVIPNTNKQNETDYKNFNKANIAGRIESINIVNHGLTTKLKIENNPVIFMFSTHINGGKRFEEFAEKGDSIIKPSLSDLLVLFKNNKTYEYTFNRQ